METKGYLALAYLALDDYDAHLNKIKPLVDWLLANRQGSHFDNTQVYKSKLEEQVKTGSLLAHTR